MSPPPSPSSADSPAHKGPKSWQKLRQLIRQLIGKLRDAGHDLPDLDKLEAEVEGKPAPRSLSVAISDLTVRDVEKKFGIREGRKTNIWPAPMEHFELNPGYEEFMREIQSVFTHTIEGEVMNEATIRVTLDHVLAGAILALRRKRPERARELYVQSETALKLEGFMWKMRKRTLRGAADYTVWYGPNKELETNFVVWEAKREFKVGEGEPQVLAAMAIVQLRRVELKKRDCTVYGVASDGKTFNFYILTNRQKWSAHTIRAQFGNYGEVISFLGNILLAASLQSPQGSEEQAAEEIGMIQRMYQAQHAASEEMDVA